MSENPYGLKNRKIKLYGQGQPEVILNRALRTIGPEKRFVAWMACTHADLKFPPSDRDFEKIDLIQWVHVTRFLELSLDSISVGYSRVLHVRGLFHRISNGTYIFPRNKNYFVIKRAFRRLKHENKTFERAHFGRRLYFKVRARRFKKDALSFPRYMVNSVNSQITLFLSRITYKRLTAISASHPPLGFYSEESPTIDPVEKVQ